MHSDPTPHRQHQKARQFMSRLPLTLAIADLPDAEAGKPFTESQMDSRATSLRLAYRVARQIVLDVTR